MEKEFRNIEEEFDRDIKRAFAAGGLEALRVKYLGRKSALTCLMSRIPGLPKEDRSAWGKKLNVLKQKIALSLEEIKKNTKSKESPVDLTYPSQEFSNGTLHILSTVSARICSIFEKLGFSVLQGNEIEDERHNFEDLNIPVEHPSRDVFDTFYLDIPEEEGGKFLLRSHTSPSQIRVMKNSALPLAVISPGRVYRPDEVDATHSFMFHQIEGFAVDGKTSFSDLKGVLLCFAREFFSPDVSLRFRPHFFPFTEPSAEVDVSCIICKSRPAAQGEGSKHGKCSVCKGKGWLEVLGCGMIHPNVLEACNIDPKKYKGFAFGMGVERMAMLKYGIDDIRLFYENDVRFLDQLSI